MISENLIKIANTIATIENLCERIHVAQQIGEVLSENEDFNWCVWDCECGVYGHDYDYGDADDYDYDYDDYEDVDDGWENAGDWDNDGDWDEYDDDYNDTTTEEAKES